MPTKSPAAMAAHVVLESRLFLLILFIVPALLIVTRLTGLYGIIPLSFYLILFDFFLLMFVVGARFVRNFSRLRRDLRYDAADRPGGEETAILRPAGEVLTEFEEAGFRFDDNGAYGEKKNPARLATTLIYGGLFLALLVGVFDYARQFSNVVLLGVGNPMEQHVGYLIGGGLISAGKMPKVQIKKQVLPNKEWPHGATEIALLSDKNVEVARKTISWGKDPLKYDGFEYHMGRLLYDVGITIATKSGYLEFANYIRFQPQEGLPAPYTHATSFKGEQRGIWKAMYDPKSKSVRLILEKDKKPLVDTVLVFQKENKKEANGFIIELNGMGEWSELHVVRSRHLYLIALGGVIALIGGAMSIFFRPQRVWIEEALDGCKVWIIGNEGKNVMRNTGL